MSKTEPTGNQEDIIYAANQLIDAVKLARSSGISDVDIGSAIGLFLAKTAGTNHNLELIVTCAKSYMQLN